MTIIWNDEDCNIMRTMWAQGRSSRDITSHISCGATRNAVMGRLNRMGLMGLGKPSKSRLDAIEKVSQLMEEPFCMGKPLHREALLALLYENSDGSASSLSLESGVSKDFCLLFLKRLPLVWPKGKPMPSRWFNGLEGNLAFLIDMAIINGKFDTVCQDNRPDSDQMAA